MDVVTCYFANLVNVDKNLLVDIELFIHLCLTTFAPDMILYFLFYATKSILYTCKFLNTLILMNIFLKKQRWYVIK